MAAVKTKGIERQVDELGRIVIPIEMRKKLGFGPRERVEIALVGNTAVLRRPGKPCSSCSGTGVA